MITLGLLMFGFVAYQLWGTGIQTAQAQRTLSSEFDESLTSPPVPVPTTTTTTTTPPTTEPTTTESAPPVTTEAPTSTSPPLPLAQPLPESGDALARLEIPRMNLNRIVVEGASADDLTKGPGHFSETPLPGQLGNAAIAGHRTTHLAPFYDIDELQAGDEIIVTTLNGRYVYHVTGTEIVSPGDYAAVIPTTDPSKATLTLVSCTPRYTARNRIVIRSELIAEESDPLTAVVSSSPASDPEDAPSTLPDEAPVSAPTPATSAAPPTAPPEATAASTVAAAVVTVPAGGPPAASPDAFADGWFSDTSAVLPVIVWALALAGVAFGIYWLARRTRRYWIGVLVGIAPFLVVLYFFYENVNRLLPPNL